MSKMVSTHEMVKFLYDQALSKEDELFIVALHQLDQTGQITRITDDSIVRLDELYHRYCTKKSVESLMDDTWNE